MQLVNDPPVANSQPVALTSVKLGDVVMPRIRIGGHFFDLPHNSFLPVHRKPGERFGKRFRGYYGIHCSIVTLSNTLVKHIMLRGVP